VYCTKIQFQEQKNFPIIKWRQLPSLHAARWNSRAIYCIIAYFLLPEWRKDLEIVVGFVAYEWQEAWFSGQMYNPEITISLSKAIENLKVTLPVN
jgi:hypothetical protein